jgi:hypothetical protein
MVGGLDLFREHFRGFEQAYALIGGAACDTWMTRSGLSFRKTKDLDIVLIVEEVTSPFVERFRGFVETGGYEVRQRQTTGTREFHRFFKPETDRYPFMLELFSRAPDGMVLFDDQRIVPVALEETVASLSAILMDDDYYRLVIDNRYENDGLSLIGAGGLIPLKARAWLDLTRRKANALAVDEDDIRKHRNDVFRLALTLAGDGPGITPGVGRDLREFLAAFPDGADEWAAVTQALKAALGATVPPRPIELRDAILRFFHLG